VDKKECQFNNVRISEAFKERVVSIFAKRALDSVVDTVGKALKDCLLVETDEVCRKSNGYQRHGETWR